LDIEVTSSLCLMVTNNHPNHFVNGGVTLSFLLDVQVKKSIVQKYLNWCKTIICCYLAMDCVL